MILSPSTCTHLDSTGAAPGPSYFKTSEFIVRLSYFPCNQSGKEQDVGVAGTVSEMVLFVASNKKKLVHSYF